MIDTKCSMILFEENHREFTKRVNSFISEYKDLSKKYNLGFLDLGLERGMSLFIVNEIEEFVFGGYMPFIDGLGCQIIERDFGKTLTVRKQVIEKIQARLRKYQEDNE
jgi:hypothetical protein